MSHGCMEMLAEKSKRTSRAKLDSNISEESEERYQLSYAFQNLSRLDVHSLPPMDKSKILKIDLTDNNFTGLNDLPFLIEFANLNTLILDKNQIVSNIRLPLMLHLTTLWLNHNQIENLAIFVQNIADSCPRLRYLSMMNNKAAPSYFNGGSLAEHNDYRMYVVARLKELSMLDDREVSAEERSHSVAVYGKMKTKRARKKSKKNVKVEEAISDLSWQELESLPDVESDSRLEMADIPDLPPVTP
ncbi:hypothetical protein BpHYR1_053307 [Brachionus plicatilis]|uniref:Uncharacterized protein n=1 Tax=Brachionus plicatilis TaxID=10195 RepID=A0A3M7T3S7_BRAPC|nr:hypothetical protein BpHYR1_053307 [Brachionus plicatilis]